MAVLRMSNGSDITVTLEIGEVLEALKSGVATEFVEMASNDGPVHVRRDGVLAVLNDPDKRGRAGFRFAEVGPGK